MPPLPFLQPPAAPRTRDVGNSDSGILRLPLIGGLTVTEAIVLEELVAERPNAFVEAAKFADAIAAAESISRVEAFTVIERAVGGQELEPAAQTLRLKYAARINAVIHIFTTSNEHTKEAAVTALIRCRQSLPDWSIADTRGLHRRLLTDIYDLYLDELESEATPASPVGEEELGKPPLESGSPAKRTGRKSPTASSTSTPANTAAPLSAESCAAPS